MAIVIAREAAEQGKQVRIFLDVFVFSIVCLTRKTEYTWVLQEVLQRRREQQPNARISHAGAIPAIAHRLLSRDGGDGMPGGWQTATSPEAGRPPRPRSSAASRRWSRRSARARRS